MYIDIFSPLYRITLAYHLILYIVTLKCMAPAVVKWHHPSSVINKCPNVSKVVQMLILLQLSILWIQSDLCSEDSFLASLSWRACSTAVYFRLRKHVGLNKCSYRSIASYEPHIQLLPFWAQPICLKQISAKRLFHLVLLPRWNDLNNPVMFYKVSKHESSFEAAQLFDQSLMRSHLKSMLHSFVLS